MSGVKADITGDNYTTNQLKMQPAKRSSRRMTATR